jgi:hypothetical protein
LGTRTYSAHIAATNNSRRSFRYWADDSVNSVLYDILRDTPQGWKALGSFRCGVGLTEHTLLPSKGLTFEAALGSNGRFKIGFTYLDSRTPNGIWRRFPSWVTQRVPWAKPWDTATSDVIDVRGPGT